MFIVSVGYPFSLGPVDHVVYKKSAKTAQEAVGIVFRRCSSKPLHSIEEYTGPKTYSERCFEVRFGHDEYGCFYVEER